MKKLSFLLVIKILVLSFILSGCGQGTKTETAPDTEKTSAQTEQAPLSLKANYFAPETIPPGIVTVEAAKEIEQKTGGKVKIQNYFSGTLVSYNDSFSATSKGVIDIALVEAGQIAQVLNLNKVFSMPLEKTPPNQAGLTKAFRELIKNEPALNEELAKMNLRWISVLALPGYNYHGLVPVKTPADVKGLKVEALGEGVPYMSEMGGAAVSLDPGDYYSSLERGLVKGQFTHWAVLGVFKTVELAKHHTFFGDGDGGLYAPVMGYIINLDTWNKLTPETQKIFEAAYDKAGTDMPQYDVDLINQAKKVVQERGDVVVHLTDKEREAWVEYMKPVNQKWIKETEAKGLPAQKTYDELMKLLDKYKS